MKIFELFGSIFVDTEQAEKSTQKIDSKFKQLSGKLSKGIGLAAKWGTALAAGAGIAAGAAFAAAGKFAETTDRIDKLSQRLGLSREGFQEWDFVLSQAGVNIESMQSGMKNLSQRMDQAIKGTGEGAKIFKQLGLSMKDANGEVKSQEQLFNESIEALQNMEDGVEKAALAQKLFGRSGQELLPLLNAQSGSVEELKKQARELGLVMGDEAVDAGVLFTDTMDQIKRGGQALFVGIMSELMPTIQEFSNLILENMPFIQQVLGAVMEVFSSSLVFIIPLIQTMITDLLPPLIELFTWIAEEVLPPVMEAFMTLATTVLPIVIDIFMSLIPIIKPIMLAIVDLIQFVLAIITGDWEAAWEHIKSFFKNALDGLIAAAKWFGGIFETIFSGIADIIAGIWKGLLDGIKGAFNFLTGGINAFIRGINKIKIPDWVPGIGGKSLNFKTLPMLEKGGNIVESGAVIVGEKGPEMLNLPQGARVTPLKDDKMESGDIVQHITINSPEPLSPATTARKIKQASRDLALRLV